MNKNRALALGLTGGFVVTGGIIMSILVTVMLKTIEKDHVSRETSDEWRQIDSIPAAVVWLIALVYIIPGLLGFTAAFVQNKCMYVTTCIFSVISLILTGLLFLFAGLTLFFVILRTGSISERCYDTDGVCKCRFTQSSKYWKDSDPDEGEDTMFKTCQSLETIYVLFVIFLLFKVITWVTMLVEFVFCCYFTCCSKTRTAGVVLVPAQQQPMLIPAQHEQHEMMPPGYVSPGYGMGYPLPSKV